MMTEASVPRSTRQRQTTGYRFGTFQGVYMPNLLTILGVIMYLRFGWVLGNVGIGKTLLIVTMSTAITVLTSLSISALATNMQLGGGGAYYILSRSLGVEAGAAIGLPLYFAYALGVSFYIAGFTESIVQLVPFLSPPLVSVATLAFLTLLAFLSADLALKTQFIILALVGLSLVSLFAGHPPQTLALPADSLIPAPQPFWEVFAVFFPAVTGILAGLAMSGDLKDPAKSLPLGTLGAVLTSYVIYMVIPVFLSRMVPNDGVLRVHSLVMRDVARWGDLILYGLWGATLSSAMGSLLGAPRMLQALAQDDIVPRLLGRGFGPGRDPRIATVATFVVALGGVLIGDLNLIAPILTMFFLTSYGLLNISAALEGLIGSPSWRPAFRVHWGLSLLGTFGCFATMFMINPGATFIAAFVTAGIYLLMQRRSLQASWGDMRYGILMLVAEYTIYRLATRQPHARTWKPNILVLSGSPTTRWYLIALADAISHGQALLTVATVFPEETATAKRLESVRTSIEEYVKRRGVKALVRVQTAPDTLTGMQTLVDTYGFGPLVPNTILLGETEKAENFLAFTQLILLISRTRRNLIMVREGDDPPVLGTAPRIDVWWAGGQYNVGLMLALAYLLHTSPEWTGACLALKTIVTSEAERDEATKRLQSFIAQGRLEAAVDVLVQSGDEVFETIRTASQQASLVFLGLRTPEQDETSEAYSQYYRRLLVATTGFPPTALVLAAEDVEFHRIFR